MTTRERLIKWEVHIEYAHPDFKQRAAQIAALLNDDWRFVGFDSGVMHFIRGTLQTGEEDNGWTRNLEQDGRPDTERALGETQGTIGA